jgi:hypothetical protein
VTSWKGTEFSFPSALPSFSLSPFSEYRLSVFAGAVPVIILLGFALGVKMARTG